MMMCLYLSVSYSTLYNDFSRISQLLRVFSAQLDATLAGPLFKMSILQDFLAARVTRGSACIFFTFGIKRSHVRNPIFRSPGQISVYGIEKSLSTRNELLYGCLGGAGGFGGNVGNAVLLSISTL